MVAFDLSSLVRYITRFTEESFAVLISLIFIFESFKKLAHVWDTHPIHIHATAESEAFKCHCEHPPYDNMTDSANNTLPTTNGTYTPTDHPIFEFLNWTSVVYEDCLTYTHRIVVHSGCIDEKVSPVIMFLVKYVKHMSLEPLGPITGLFSNRQTGRDRQTERDRQRETEQYICVRYKSIVQSQHRIRTNTRSDNSLHEQICWTVWKEVARALHTRSGSSHL